MVFIKFCQKMARALLYEKRWQRRYAEKGKSNFSGVAKSKVFD
jgi:hypothetical protein